MGIMEFIERSERAPSAEALFELLLAQAAEYKFDYVAYGQLGMRSGDPALPYPAVMLNYPPAWQAYYARQQYQRIDPVVVFAPLAARPLSWAELQAGRLLDRRQRQLFAEAAAFGLRHGCSVPLHGPGGRVAMLSFAGATAQALEAIPLSHLQLLAVQFDLAFQRRRPSQALPAQLPRLSARERDCLAWSARGKSAWDIGVILGISPNTVKFHLKNALRKLQATNRTTAALAAMRLGLIPADPQADP